MPKVIYVTAVPFKLNSFEGAGMGPAGIGVPNLDRKPSHQTDVILALKRLAEVPVGSQLLREIVRESEKTGRKRVSVLPWDLQNANKCRALAGSDFAKTDLARALDNRQSVGTAISIALGRASMHVTQQDQFDWLVDRINQQPILKIQGMPSNIPSSNVYGTDWLSADMIEAWVKGTKPFPEPLTEPRATDARISWGPCSTREPPTRLSAATSRSCGTPRLSRSGTRWVPSSRARPTSLWPTS
jgi:hypothetical protein